MQCRRDSVNRVNIILCELQPAGIQYESGETGCIICICEIQDYLYIHFMTKKEWHVDKIQIPKTHISK